MIQKTTETSGVGRVKLLTKQQSTEAWNSTTSLFGHTDRLRIPVNTHTHTCRGSQNFLNLVDNPLTFILKDNVGNI